MRILRVATVAAMAVATFVPSALPAGQISHQLQAPDGGPTTPGPTNPNAPSS
jgi:hypothetical protein